MSATLRFKVWQPPTTHAVIAADAPHELPVENRFCPTAQLRLANAPLIDYSIAPPSRDESHSQKSRVPDRRMTDARDR